ncbi:hypothetical protein [Weissella minor]|uniref:Uncharacterized protein n=1 Tax=Weissella minor TaxID=1620 RepID=A0A0R2JIX0_9LACO|nr:hypothetical protein [Weissella minor]KRN77241.1 hypothetical protein IV67_GL000026 [Weissella minor]
MTSKEQYLHDHFFNPLDEPKTMGTDLLGHALIENDEVYKSDEGVFLISALTKAQKEMAKVMKLKKAVL